MNQTCEACGHSAPLLYVSPNLSLCAVCDDQYRRDKYANDPNMYGYKEDWIEDQECVWDIGFDENENDYNAEW